MIDLRRSPQRRLLAATTAAAMMFLAASCGEDDSTAPTDTAAESSVGNSADEAADTTAATVPNQDNTDSSSTDGATRMVQTVDGEVEVPVDPQRIVSLNDQNAMLPLLELDVVPVASNGASTEDGEEFFRRVDDFDTSAVTWIGTCCDANLEAVAAQNPDLIVTDTFSGADQYSELQQIAPVVRFDPFGQPLVNALEQWADLVGRSERGDELRADYDARIAAVVEELGDPSEITVALVTSWDGGSTWAYVDDSQATAQVVDDLMVTRPDDWDPEVEHSIERFPEHVADFVVVYDFGGREAPDAELDAFVNSPVFQAHPAVAAGQWERVDATQTVGSGWSKLDNLLNVLEELLVEPNLDRSIAP